MGAKSHYNLRLGIKLCLFIPVIIFFSAGLILAYQNEPEGFRDIKWQTEKRQISGLRFHQRYSGYVEYVKDNEDLNFEGAKATRILYTFIDNKLETVTLQFEPSDEARYNFLRDSLISKFGEGEAIGKKDIFWRGEETNTKLNSYAKGVEIILYDNMAFSKRLKQIDEFNAKFNKTWDELLKDNDAKTAAKKLKKWFAREGKELLNSYYVSPKGGQINLNFKGVGSYVFSPSPANTEKEIESQKLYSVTEVLKILHSNPERFKDKDILLKAAIVDGVKGFGCDDYFILTDLEYKKLYGKQYEVQTLTAKEKEAIKNIPILKSGPTSSMPEGILAGSTLPIKDAVFRGHFFDHRMKPCQGGWKRFVIIEKVTEVE